MKDSAAQSVLPDIPLSSPETSFPRLYCIRLVHGLRALASCLPCNFALGLIASLCNALALDHIHAFPHRSALLSLSRSLSTRFLGCGHLFYFLVCCCGGLQILYRFPHSRQFIWNGPRGGPANGRHDVTKRLQSCLPTLGLVPNGANAPWRHCVSILGYCIELSLSLKLSLVCITCSGGLQHKINGFSIVFDKGLA